ncbi:MAG: calcium-binding protein, partial [Thermomicrobiales bacterium]
MQQRYGANTTTNAGDNVYVLVEGPGELYRTIWDVGGIDSIEYHGEFGVEIDLRPATLLTEWGGAGGLSRMSAWLGGFTIPSGVIIENATGGSGGDWIRGNASANTLNGGGGGDTLLGGDGADTLNGGAGGDTAFYSGDPTGVTVNLLLQTATDGWGATDTLIGIEHIIGSDFNDHLIGGAGDASGTSNIQGTNGDDYIEDHSLNWGILSGGGGNDTLIGGTARVSLYGDIGDDTMIGSSVADTDVLGGNGNDFIDGRGGDDALDGGGGEDTLYGGIGNDYLYGDDGADVLSGDQGRDNIVGGDGNDTIVIRTGQFEAGESIDGSDGVDTLLTMGLNNDYRAGTLINLERLQFQQLAGELTINLMINATQIGAGLSTSLVVLGSAAQDSVQ